MASATIFPDTTILIQYRALDHVDWDQVLGVENIKLMLAPSVLNEIKEIENQTISTSLAEKASETLQALNRILSQSHSAGSTITAFELDEPEIDFNAEGLAENEVTDLLIASIISYQKASALEYILLLTDDEETRRKALHAGIEVNKLPGKYLRKEQAPLPATAESKEETTPSSSPLVDLLAKPSTLFNAATSSSTDKPVRAPHTPSNVVHLFNDNVVENGSRVKGNHTNGASQTSSVLPDTISNEDKPSSVAQNAPPDNESIPSFIDIIQEPARPDSSARDFKPGSLKTERTEQHLTQEPVATNSENRPLIAPVPAPPKNDSFSFISPAAEETQAVSGNDANYLIPTEQKEEAARLRMMLAENELRTTVTIHHPIYPSLDEVNQHLSSIRSSYPKLELPPAASGDGLDSAELTSEPTVDAIATNTILQRKTQRIKKYNASLDSYYAGVEKYLSDVAEYENFKRRSAELNLTLINDLPESLKSLYISIHFPGNVRVYYEDNLPEKPSTPPPPEEPDLGILFDPIRLPYVPIPNELSNITDLRMRGRNPAPIEIRWNKGWDVIYSIKEIEKNTHVPFNPLYIAFNSFDHATSFRVNYRITVASVSYEQLGDLEVVVRKEI